MLTMLIITNILLPKQFIIMHVVFTLSIMNAAVTDGDDDETSNLLMGGSLIERVVNTSRRMSVAQQHVQSQRKYYEGKTV